MEYLLRPTETLKAAVATRRAELGVEENTALAAMHIRRGDKVKGCKGSGMCAKHMNQEKEAELISTRRFSDAMKTLLLHRARGVGAAGAVGTTPKVLYVSTDDEGALAEINASSHEMGLTLLNRGGVQKKRRYDDKKKDGGYSDVQHTIGALVEMELLAHADPVVFTFSSAFGGAAFVRNFARRGGCLGGWASLENGATFVPRAMPNDLYSVCRTKAENITLSFNGQTPPKLCELDSISHQFFGTCDC